jgi:hypothetical protein
VQAFYKGGMNNFEVIPIENYFVIAFNGKFITKIEHNDDWVQRQAICLMRMSL